MVTAHTAHSDQVPEPRALLAWTTQKRIDYRLYGWCKMIVARDGELWNEINAQAEADVRKGSSSTTEDRQLVVDSLLRALEANSEGFNYLHDHNWDIIISALKKENMFKFKITRQGHKVDFWNAQEFVGRLRSRRRLSNRLKDPYEGRLEELDSLFEQLLDQPRRRVVQSAVKAWVKRQASPNGRLLFGDEAIEAFVDNLLCERPPEYSEQQSLRHHRRVGFRQIALRPDLRTIGLAREGGYLI
ncbi:hypothetical protein JCM3766R1_006773 [Sporobolomyces carnicolor]